MSSFLSQGTWKAFVAAAASALPHLHAITVALPPPLPGCPAIPLCLVPVHPAQQSHHSRGAQSSPRLPGSDVMWQGVARTSDSANAPLLAQWWPGPRTEPGALPAHVHAVAPAALGSIARGVFALFRDAACATLVLRSQAVGRLLAAAAEAEGRNPHGQAAESTRWASSAVLSACAVGAGSAAGAKAVLSHSASLRNLLQAQPAEPASLLCVQALARHRQAHAMLGQHFTSQRLAALVPAPRQSEASNGAYGRHLRELSLLTFVALTDEVTACRHSARSGDPSALKRTLELIAVASQEPRLVELARTARACLAS